MSSDDWVCFDASELTEIVRRVVVDHGVDQQTSDKIAASFMAEMAAYVSQRPSKRLSRGMHAELWDSIGDIARNRGPMTTDDFCRECGIGKRTLQRRVKEGLVPPPSGRGKATRWTLVHWLIIGLDREKARLVRDEAYQRGLLVRH
jgi:hypothetical protein